MYKNKKTWFVLTGIALSFAMAACGSGDKLMTDTGSAGQKELGKEEYLNPDALNQEKETVVNKKHKVITLEKGVFEEKALNQTLQRAYINIPVVELELEEGSVRVGEYVSGNMLQHVEEGDVILKVQPDVDAISLEEAKLQLTRLQERYLKAETDFFEELEEAKKDKLLLYEGYQYGTYEKEIDAIKCRQMELDWAKTKRNYELQMAEVQEQIADITQSSTKTEVMAPISGNIFFEYKYIAGGEIVNGDYICHIITSDDFYVKTTNQADEFGYGMALKFRNLDEEVKGTVISGGSRLLYGNLDTGEATFSVEFEDNAISTGRMQVTSVVMEGNLKTIENVIVIPKQAVTVEEDEYFVTVLKDDGSLLKTEFIPGGENTESYWVYEGLEAGMQIVY